jgi:L,D-transpeptidase ErfK/SrfK
MPESTSLNQISMFIGLILAAAAFPATAGEYSLNTNTQLIGVLKTETARYEDTLPDIARAHGVGYEEIRSANPDVDPWLPGENAEILIPTQFILPDGPRVGIVVNLPEHRMYYYPKPKEGELQRVITYPISTGKMDWKTPLGTTKITTKQENPSWHPPKSVRDGYIARGQEPPPPVVPPGPDNPLGAHAMRLGIPGGAYLIHGTNRPVGVGMQVTHGCIRMYPEDISELYSLVAVNQQVTLIDQPSKLGWYKGTLYLERHPLLEGAADPGPEEYLGLQEKVLEATLGKPVEVDWQRVEHTFTQARGVPVAISRPRRN